MKKIYIMLVGLLMAVAMQGQEVVSKQKADSAYIEGNYSEAITIYETLLQEGESAEVYYNLGNAYFKTDEIAKAILNYERALLMNPNNSDIKANLDIARAKTIDEEVVIPDIFFIAWTKALMHSCSLNVWAWAGIVTFIATLILAALFFFSKRMALKKTGFFAGIVCLLLTVIFNLFAAGLKSELQNRNRAIVLAPSVTVRSTPSENGTSLFILHEGYKVEIKDNSMREWKEIRLENDKVGWVPTESIEII